MKNKIYISVITLLLAGSTVFAAPAAKKPNKKSTSSETGGSTEHAALPAYGMAGCGPGSLFIEENEMLPQLGAWLANWVLGATSTQTSAMSTGSSHCNEQPRETAQIEQEVFIAANLNNISKEAAQGSGKHLEALAEVFGCSESGASALRELFRERHDSIFKTNDSTVVLSTLRSEIKSNARLSGACDRV